MDNYKIKPVLMKRDGLSSDEADALIDEAADELQRLLDEGDLMGADDVCLDYFGLEPDYLEDLMERLM